MLRTGRRARARAVGRMSASMVWMRLVRALKVAWEGTSRWCIRQVLAASGLRSRRSYAGETIVGRGAESVGTGRTRECGDADEAQRRARPDTRERTGHFSAADEEFRRPTR